MAKVKQSGKQSPLQNLLSVVPSFPLSSAASQPPQRLRWYRKGYRPTAGGKATLERYGVEHFRYLATLRRSRKGQRLLSDAERMVEIRAYVPRWVYDTLQLIAAGSSLSLSAVIREGLIAVLQLWRQPAGPAPAAVRKERGAE
jgi:hypothetical protein